MTAHGDMKLSAGKYELVTPSKISGAPNQKAIGAYVLAASILASLNAILLGYDVGVMSGAQIFIKKDLQITQTQIEILVGSLSIVSLFGAAVGGRTSDSIGRRWTMALAAVVFTIGAILMGFAPSFLFLMLGRILAGLGVGVALMIAPVYTAEVAPASSRGSLVSLPEIFINAGVLLGYISNYFLAGLPVKLSWRMMLGLGAVPSVFLGLAALAMPESPRWLVMRNRIPEAMAVLIRTSEDEHEAKKRLSEIAEAAGIPVPSFINAAGEEENEETSNQKTDHPFVKHATKKSGEGVWKELILSPSPAVKRMLTVVLGVQFFQQASGIDASVYYSPVIFQHAGIKSEAGILGSTIVVGIAKTSFILVAIFLIDKVGRRLLLLVSATGMTVSLTVISISLFFIQNVAQGSFHGVAILAILAVCFNVAFFSVGFGPINWVLNSEIFPLRLRAQAAGLGVVVNRIVSGIIAMTFLSISERITVAGTFLHFAAVSLLALIFVYLYVPETKGKSLEEIESLFEQGPQTQELELRVTPSV